MSKPQSLYGSINLTKLIRLAKEGKKRQRQQLQTLTK